MIWRSGDASPRRIDPSPPFTVLGTVAIFSEILASKRSLQRCDTSFVHMYRSSLLRKQLLRSFQVGTVGLDGLSSCWNSTDVFDPLAVFRPDILGPGRERSSQLPPLSLVIVLVTVRVDSYATCVSH